VSYFSTQQIAESRHFYKVRLQFNDYVLGGVPFNPEMIEGWTKTRYLGVEDEDLWRRRYLSTLAEVGQDAKALMTVEQADAEHIDAAAELIAEERNSTGFRRDKDGGLYLAGYQIKAMLKEAANIALMGQSLGGYKKTVKTGTRKGQVDTVGAKQPRAYVAERVFVNPERIYLGRPLDSEGVGLRRDQGDLEMTLMGRVWTPQGPKQIIGKHEAVYKATIEFEVMTDPDALTKKQWDDTWLKGQENGIGSGRSLGNGRFTLIDFARIEDWREIRFEPWRGSTRELEAVGD
jgi:hypothetical protein